MVRSTVETGSAADVTRPILVDVVGTTVAVCSTSTSSARTSRRSPALSTRASRSSRTPAARSRVARRSTRSPTYYTDLKVQPYSEFESSARGGSVDGPLAGAVGRGARGRRPREVIFGPSTSANTYVLAHAFAEVLEPGHEVIVTNQDHEANTGAIRRAADPRRLHGEGVADRSRHRAAGHRRLRGVADRANRARDGAACVEHRRQGERRRADHGHSPTPSVPG